MKQLISSTSLAHAITNCLFEQIHIKRAGLFRTRFEGSGCGNAVVESPANQSFQIEEFEWL